MKVGSSKSMDNTSTHLPQHPPLQTFILTDLLQSYVFHLPPDMVYPGARLHLASSTRMVKRPRCRTGRERRRGRGGM